MPGSFLGLSCVEMPDERAEMQELLGRLRNLSEIPEPLFRLLEILVQREAFNPHETPTVPAPRMKVVPIPREEEESSPGLVDLPKEELL
jgi:hypothetical protein